MKFLIVRGAFLNPYEGQNFEPLAISHEITAISSKYPIHDVFSFPVKKFYSPYDLVTKTGPAGRGFSAFFNRVLGDSHFLFGLERYVEKNGPFQVAHIAETHYGYGAQIVRLKQRGLINKIISTCWETIPFNNESISKKKNIKDLVRQETDYFICPTDRAKKALVAEGVRAQKIAVVRVGVDLQKFKNKIKNVRGETDRLPTILFVGRLVKEKGIFDLLEVLRQIKSPRTQLRVIGDGPLKGRVKNYIDKYFSKIASVESVNYDLMPSIYNASDILVVPSYRTKTWEEQYGMVLIEAMASGLAVVAYNSGAIAEVVSAGGLVLPEGDKSQLKEALLKMLQSPALRRKLGIRARLRAEKEFDRNRFAYEMGRIYNVVQYT